RQRVQVREPIFHLLERGQHGLAIVRHRLVISGLRRGKVGAIQSTLEDRLQQRAAQGPDCVWSCEQISDVGALESANARERELRIESCLGNSDESVLVSHLPLGGGDVGTTLKQIIWNSERNRRRSCIQRSDWHAECRSRISGEHRDGVFVLRALLLHEVELRDRGIEHGLLLRQIQSRSYSAGVTILDQLQSLALECDRVLHDLSFGVEFAQSEVVGRQLRRQDEVYVVEIGRGGLQRSVGGLETSPDLTEEIRLVIQQKRNLV